MKLSNKAFDILRFMCELLVPGIGALYLGVSKIWGLPYGTEVAETCICIATFIGIFVGVNRASYKKDQAFFDGMEGE